jgi:hypothetical protein
MSLTVPKIISITLSVKGANLYFLVCGFHFMDACLERVLKFHHLPQWVEGKMNHWLNICEKKERLQAILGVLLTFWELKTHKLCLIQACHGGYGSTWEINFFKNLTNYYSTFLKNSITDLFSVFINSCTCCSSTSQSIVGALPFFRKLRTSLWHTLLT